MSEQVNVFRSMAEGNSPEKKKPGRQPMKKPIGESAESKPAVGATTRKPVGMRGINKTPTRAGFRRRWVNDKEDRVQLFLDGGYSPVKDPDGETRTRRAGGNVNSVLMEIDENLYNEDQQAKFAQWNQDAQERLKPIDGRGYYKPQSKM